MKLELLEDLYLQTLAELFDAEKQLVKTLPKIAKAMTTDEVRQLFEKHTEETKVQMERLKQLMTQRGVDQARKSKSMGGLVSETKDLLKEGASDPELLEAALVANAQKIEAQEITTYACAHNFARLLGFHDDLKPLEDSFHEEEQMEEKLSTLSESLNVEELESEERAKAA